MSHRACHSGTPVISWAAVCICWNPNFLELSPQPWGCHPLPVSAPRPGALPEVSRPARRRCQVWPLLLRVRGGAAATQAQTRWPPARSALSRWPEFPTRICLLWGGRPLRPVRGKPTTGSLSNFSNCRPSPAARPGRGTGRRVRRPDPPPLGPRPGERAGRGAGERLRAINTEVSQSPRRLPPGRRLALHPVTVQTSRWQALAYFPV